MKYIITESRINKLVSNYLNGQKWQTWDIGDGEFNVADGEYGKDIIHYRIQESITVPDREFNVLYIDGNLVTKIGNLFGLRNKDAVHSIINWFNEKYDKTITDLDWEWLDNDDNEEDEDNN